jgi:hypothetical protein
VAAVVVDRQVKLVVVVLVEAVVLVVILLDRMALFLDKVLL